MKKLVCVLLAAVFLLALVIPIAALAEGEDAEANGVYDPFAPENQTQGVSPEDRHLYEAQPGMRPFASGSIDYRYVNVLLSQAQHESSVVWFTGNYALCDATGAPLFRVESEYAYTVSRLGASLELRAADGALLYMGGAFSFREYAPPAGLEFNYFKVEKVSNGTSPSDRIYKGELYCSYQTSNPWQGLCLVNRIYIEEYLKGVLPAEIGSGSPDAALQAQAIVARNYAVKSKRTDGRVFDVYDYNASQVYFGIYVFNDTDNAVNATRGQVLLYNNIPIKAFYTNTNGGYTEISTNQWSGSEYTGNESIRDDEFDLSYTNYYEHVTIPAVVSGSNARVDSLIKQALIPALGDASLDLSNVSVGGISMAVCDCGDSACLHHNKALQKCTHFCSLDVTFTDVVVRGVALLGPVTVTLKDIDFYVSPANGRPLGFFSRGELSRYWLIPQYSAAAPNVVESYIIRHARHGPGVGLSQQGAILRAKAGHSLNDILAFYFPDSPVGNIAGLGEPDALADISTVSFQKTFAVLGHDAYVYKAMEEESFLLGVLRAGMCAEVKATSSDKKWAKIGFNGADGYIKIEAFVRTFKKIKITNINEYYDVYDEPAAGTKLGRAYPDQLFELVQVNALPNYHKILFNGKYGYVSSRYSRLMTAADAGEEAGIVSYPITVAVPAGYGENALWVDGIRYEGIRSGDQLTILTYSPALTNAVMYRYNGDVPVGMTVWLLSFQAGSYAAALQSGLTDLLSYKGFSIRITGERGLRYWNGISAAAKGALTGAGINGYKLVEYGTVVYTNPARFAYYPFIKDTSSTSIGKAYWTQDGKVNDLVFSTNGDLVNFTIVLRGYSDQQLSVNYPFRGYAILSNGTNAITVYGPQMARSIYYVAKAYMGIYQPGTDEYAYVKSIVDIVERP